MASIIKVKYVSNVKIVKYVPLKNSFNYVNYVWGKCIF